MSWYILPGYWADGYVDRADIILAGGTVGRREQRKSVEWNLRRKPPADPETEEQAEQVKALPPRRVVPSVPFVEDSLARASVAERKLVRMMSVPAVRDSLARGTGERAVVRLMMPAVRESMAHMKPSDKTEAARAMRRMLTRSK